MKEPEAPPTTTAPAPEPSASPRRRSREDVRTFRCRRCQAELTFPTGYSAQHRAPVVFCRKCGAQTRLPMRHRWVWIALGAVLFVAAWVFVIFTFIREEALAP